MRKAALGLPALTLLALAGCVPSLQPFYTAGDLELVPGLVGSWTEHEDAEWTFESGDGTSYGLKVRDDRVESKFAAHRIRLGGSLYLDTCVTEVPGEGKGDDPRFFQLHLVPAHLLAEVEIGEDVLRLSWMRPDWVSEAVREGRVRIAHEVLRDADGTIVLTASPRKLQRFVRRIADEPDAWTDPTELGRKRQRPRQTGRAPCPARAEGIGERRPWFCPREGFVLQCPT